MHILRKNLLIVFCCLAGVNAFAQFDPVQFATSFQQVSDSVGQIRFTGTIDDGWHVYGSHQGMGGPTAASIHFEAMDGVEPLGELESEGDEKEHFDNMFGMAVRYFEHSVAFVQQVRILTPQFSLKGYLQYGACDDHSCLPPTAVEFQYGSQVEQAHASQPIADTSSASSSSLWGVLLAGFVGGLLALLTPCVWPIIPMTVSFFLKRSRQRSQGIRDAMLYGVGIIVIYVGLGLFVTLLFGASALNSLSTNAVFNIFFCLLLVVFAVSFLGAFELTLPASWSNAIDEKAEKTSGFLSILLMAFTLALVSFSCTGPIIGFLLVELGTGNGIVAPTIGMFGFALALALPFTLFALFPQWLKSMPKSGGWMNVVKVTLGFIELAFALKFLSVADLAYGWHILDRETFLSLWIAIFGLLGMYLLGRLKFRHDDDNTHVGVTRFLLGLVSMAFAIYMLPGLWGAPLKAISAFAPPMSTQDFSLYEHEVRAQYNDFEEGMRAARLQRKPVMLDFTGYGCVNCRKMEASVWTDERVGRLMTEEYVLVTLYVDDKTLLDHPQTVVENGHERKLRTVGDKWSHLQRTMFGANAQPFYVLLDNEGNSLVAPYSFDEDIDNYVDFLQRGLSEYRKQ
ncbi:MAG: cytochrome c biogenesis protein CcdA [Bacteroidales bacterium]|nr:cytochrome c biogenesis protein CcdA [Bacteroidales bacterium]